MSADNMVGRTVAGYHLAKYIGEGGTATVYRAEHPEKGSAAVKLLRPRLAQDPIAVKRFLREAEYGSRVTHPNIVRTYDYGQSDGLHYLALEWAQGEPLEEFVNRSLSTADSFNLEFQQMVTEYCWGAVWGREGLEKKTRSLLNIAMLSTLNRPHELKVHVKGAIRNGATKAEIREVLLQVAIYAGVPAAVDSFRVAREALVELEKK